MDDPGVRTSLVAIACAAACFATPAAYLHARTWAQRRTLRVVRSGVPVVLAVQRLESRSATAFFELTAFSVSVPFYALALPLLAWVRAAGRRRVFAACSRHAPCAADWQCAALPQADRADDACVRGLHCNGRGAALTRGAQW